MKYFQQEVAITIATLEEIGVSEEFEDRTIINLKIVPSNPMAIVIIAKVVMEIGTNERYYTKGEVDMSFVDLDKKNIAFVDFSNTD